METGTPMEFVPSRMISQFIRPGSPSVMNMSWSRSANL